MQAQSDIQFKNHRPRTGRPSGAKAGRAAGAVLSLLFLIFTALPAVAGEVHPKLRAALKSAESGAEIPVIVRMAERADLAPHAHGPKQERVPRVVSALKEKAETTQKPVRDFLRSRGAKREKTLWIINGLAATVSAESVEALAALPGVESVRLDEAIQAPKPLVAAEATPEWNLSAVHAPDLWALGYRGQGVVVASMDTGVDVNHPDLAGKWRGGGNSWYDPNGQHAAPYDNDGHGTGTMGVMVGGSAGGSAIGMAPDARWIAVKIFNDAGSASFSAIHDGFWWLLDPDGNPETDDAPDVVNNSWGLDATGVCDAESRKFQTDVQALRAAGIAAVFAAGNSGPAPNTDESPANYPESVAVGAVDQWSNIASFSSRGPSACDGTIYPELTAPGVHIKTADLTFGGVFPDSYAVWSGTSFAAPHVAGAMALLLSAFPDLSVPEIETALGNSATDLGSAGGDNSYGRGLLDVLASYQALLDVSVTPASHDFGTVNVGSDSPPRTFTVRNQASTDLALGTATISGSGSGDFTIGNDGCSGTTLLPGESCTVEVVYHPLSEGTSNAELVVAYSDPAPHSISISLRGATFTAVTLLAPNGGEVIPSGSHYQLRWGAPVSAVEFNLAYSVNNGLTWALINKKGKISATSYDWLVPAPPANRPKTLVRVTGFDSNGKVVGKDRSDGPSVIEVVRLTSPNGGESLTSGDLQTITWMTNSTRRPVTAVKLLYTLNGGLSWRLIATLNGNPGSYDWTAPPVAVARSKCRVRIVLKDSTGLVIGKDVSDSWFTINPASSPSP